MSSFEKRGRSIILNVIVKDSRRMHSVLPLDNQRTATRARQRQHESNWQATPPCPNIRCTRQPASALPADSSCNGETHQRHCRPTRHCHSPGRCCLRCCSARLHGQPTCPRRDRLLRRCSAHCWAHPFASASLAPALPWPRPIAVLFQRELFPALFA